MEQSKVLEFMIGILRFGENIYGKDEDLPKEMRGLEIRDAGNKVFVGYGYGNYGMRKHQLYFPNATAAMNFLSAHGVNIGMLEIKDDPCLYNGL